MPHEHNEGGYTDCACRDCFDIAIGTAPVLCWECAEAGCDVTGEGDCQRGLDEEEWESIKHCPKCNATLDTLKFMGVQPEGYVCQNCKVAYNLNLEPMAVFIG